MRVLREMEHTNHVLLSVVPKELAPKMLEEASAVMGDLTEPHHGVAFVVPLDQAIGLRQPENGDGYELTTQAPLGGKTEYGTFLQMSSSL